MNLSDEALDAAIDTYFNGHDPGGQLQYLRARFQAFADALAPHIRKQVGEEAAYEIRAELVCCDIYERDHSLGRAGRTHAICFWSEASARLTEEVAGKPTEETIWWQHQPHRQGSS